MSKEAKQPAQQEPVAWMYEDDYQRMLTSETFCKVWSIEVGSAERGLTTVPLYTTPPQRTWVGLTEDEMAEIVEGCDNIGWDVAPAIEAKLKELNT